LFKTGKDEDDGTEAENTLQEQGGERRCLLEKQGRISRRVSEATCFDIEAKEFYDLNILEFRIGADILWITTR
jgi:hypothetical protein